VAYETPTTRQEKHGVNRSGDGTVPYCTDSLPTPLPKKQKNNCFAIDSSIIIGSLAYCKVWQDKIKDDGTGRVIEIKEIPYADHREMMKDNVLINTVLDYVCESPSYAEKIK